MSIDITKKQLPVGQSFFDRVIADGYYYVDKTLFIKDILDRKAAVTLCTRPRRFGKTLNQTMLKCFFENTAHTDGGKDMRALFSGLKIEAAGERYMEHQGKYPVVFLTFKEAKRGSFEKSYMQLKKFIANEFDRHNYVCEKITSIKKRKLFEKIIAEEASLEDYSASLLFLSECLENYHGKKAVILIDEYDVPLENSWSRGFYQEMIDFIRPLLSCAFKDNPHLQTAVMTGCLRISKESIFTGLNNLEVVSILNKYYSEYFGFTQAEMDAMLEYYGLSEKRQLVMDWYNGYLFGNTEVYNPFSSVLVVNNWLADVNEYPKPYWVNTSSNDIVRDMIDKADAETKEGIETLMAGRPVSAVIHEDMTYGEIHKNAENLWNFLLFTGYLKKVGHERMEGVKTVLSLSIPNLELQYIYETKIKEWFEDKIASKNLDALQNAVLSGDVETFQQELSALLSESISYMDSAESLYHGVMIGALARINGYRLKSNRESGDGRSDLVLYSANQRNGTAVIFEFKVAPKAKLLSNACDDALKQIDDKNYAAYWDEEGYKNIIKYGIGFYGKSCEIRKGK
ncbi:hypothetical protein R80B4_00777 [Fibrobacteres bacterium R8-0-B4]